MPGVTDLLFGGSSAPPPPPPVAPPPPPPAPPPVEDITGPMMAMMQNMMSQFATAQMQMFQALQLPAMDIPNYMPPAFDLEAERQAIADRLKENPADAQARLRGRASTKVVSPLEDDEADFDILRVTPTSGAPVTGTNRA